MPSLLQKIGWQLKRVLPRPVFRVVRDAGLFALSKKKALNRRHMQRIDRAALVHDLRRAGVTEGDVIFVHSALSRIGDVEGGAETVVDALMETVGVAGTIVMPAFTSAEDFILESKRGAILDLRTSASRTGKITEALRQRPNVYRSSHPFSSCIAWGHYAEYITADHAADARIWHERSPLARVLELQGTIVGLGTDVGTVTLYHCAEDLWGSFPFRTYGEKFIARYIDSTGTLVARCVLRYDPHVSQFRIDQPFGDWIRELFRTYLTRVGVLVPFSFGCAPAWTMDANALFEEVKSLASAGVTIYSRPSEEVARIMESRQVTVRRAGII